MLENPMDVLAQFPVRKSKKQKQAFRDAVQAYAEGAGYDVTVEKGSLGSRNVVIGNPDTAKYLITAHYDTCAHLPFPNLITPCNIVTFLLYQFAVVGLFLIVAVVAGVAAGLLIDSVEMASFAALAVYWLAFILMLVGPANQHNANDNTSGVVTVLEIAGALPENLRDQVCFVLFDLEEAGLIGSASYRKAHKAATENQIVLNLDCVGDGDEILMFPNKKVKKDASLMKKLELACVQRDSKSVSLYKKGFSVYPSDQKNFPLGLGIAAFRRAKGVGLYCGRIHTNRDTILEAENVTILRDALTALIADGAQKESRC